MVILSYHFKSTRWTQKLMWRISSNMVSKWHHQIISSITHVPSTHDYILGAENLKCFSQSHRATSRTPEPLGCLHMFDCNFYAELKMLIINLSFCVFLRCGGEWMKWTLWSTYTHVNEWRSLFMIASITLDESPGERSSTEEEVLQKVIQ